jgi:hypothetical protein
MNQRLALILGLAALLAACHASSSRSAAAPIPPCPAPLVDVSSWQVVDQPMFAFRLPPGFRQVPVRGVDSYVEQFEADRGNALISFDLGWYSADLQPDSGFYAQYARCGEVIGGHAATVITAVLRNPEARRQDGRHVAAATWRNFTGAPGTGPHTHLTFWAETRDPRRLGELLAMLRTVEFRRR